MDYNPTPVHIFYMILHVNPLSLLFIYVLNITKVIMKCIFLLDCTEVSENLKAGFKHIQIHKWGSKIRKGNIKSIYNDYGSSNIQCKIFNKVDLWIQTLFKMSFLVDIILKQSLVTPF